MSLQSKKHKYGIYKKKANNTMKLVEHTDCIPLSPGLILGFTYEVISDSTQQLKTRNDYLYPNGKQETIESTIETNLLYATIQSFSTIDNTLLGAMVYRLSFPENPEIEPLEQTFHLYDANKGLLFQNNPFSPATDTDIQEFEKKYNTSLCSDYVQFLKTHNGLDLCWWGTSEEFDKDKGAYEVNEYGYARTKYPFYEDMQKIQETENWEWPYETNKLFGLGNKNPYLDMKDFHMPNLFYHNDLVKYAYPIGQDGGGNALMQIASGEHRGKLAMLDHEVYGPMADWIEGKTEGVFEIPPEEATADLFLNDCFEYGGLTLFEITFDDYLTALIQKHKKLYEELKKKYGK